MKKNELSKKTLAKVLKKISQTYQIRNINYYELLTIFFKLLYLSRRTNSCLNADIFEISYSDFKKLYHTFMNFSTACIYKHCHLGMTSIRCTFPAQAMVVVPGFSTGKPSPERIPFLRTVPL